MFFYLAKVLWFLLQPSTLIALLIAYGSILIWTGWARWGRRFVSIGAILLLIAGLSPLGNALILPLEDRFPRANLDEPPPPTGFIVLGGAEDRLVGLARKAPTLNEAGERIVETVMLARKFPEAKIAFSGGDAGILYSSDSEAAGAARMLTDMGVAKERLILEAGARDTYENAVNLKAELDKLGLLGPGKRWVLITSAYHMPRAIAAFRQAGLDVEPWPVDYRTRGRADLTRPFDKVSEGLRRVDVATREWLGLFAYWLAGRSATLFPAPKLASLGCDLATTKAGSQPSSHVDPILSVEKVLRGEAMIVGADIDVVYVEQEPAIGALGHLADKLPLRQLRLVEGDVARHVLEREPAGKSCTWLTRSTT